MVAWISREQGSRARERDSLTLLLVSLLIVCCKTASLQRLASPHPGANLPVVTYQYAATPYQPLSLSLSLSLSASLALPAAAAALTPAPPLVHVRSQGCVASAHITPNNVTNSIRLSLPGFLVLRGALLRCTSYFALHTALRCTTIQKPLLPHHPLVLPSSPPLSCKRSPTRGNRRQQ